MSEIKLSPELVRLTRRTAEQQQFSFARQAARCVALQAVMELDPEEGFLVYDDLSLAANNTLVRTADVNDIVVNERHIDIAVLDGSEVELALPLASTPYIECGSLVVRMDGPSSGSVVGYVSGESWDSAARSASKDSAIVRISFKLQNHFDLNSCLKSIESQHAPNVNKESATPAKAEQVLTFVRDARTLDLQTRRNVISAALGSEQVRDSISALDNFVVDHAQTILRQSSIWETRISRVSSKIQERFPYLTAEQIEPTVREIAEQLGGQTEAPQFKERLSKQLTKKHLFKKASSAVRDAMSPIVDSLVAGKSAADSVKGFVKDKFAFEVARVIQEKRSALGQFAAASAAEIGFAFQQLQPQPAYATHSQSDDGIAAINEALELCEAAAMIQAFLDMDFD